MNPDIDKIVRVALYRAVVDHQRMPSVDELSASLGLGVSLVDESLERLAAAHVIVRSLDGRVQMAMPFSGVPTAVRVTRAGKNWWANCVWDSLGIAAAIDGGVAEATIETTCGDCGDAIAVSVSRGQVRPAGARLDPVAHFAVPAARWWDDIGFT